MPQAPVGPSGVTCGRAGRLRYLAFAVVVRSRGTGSPLVRLSPRNNVDLTARLSQFSVHERLQLHHLPGI